MNTPKTEDTLTTIYWGTYYAGQTVGLTDCTAQSTGNEGPLQLGSQLNINSSNDLSQIIVGNSGGYVQTIQYVNTGGLRSSTIKVYGQGPSGTQSGSINMSFLTSGGFVHTLSLTSSSPGWHTDSFEDSSGIISIWWTHSTME
jgi:hypothetical protein